MRMVMALPTPKSLRSMMVDVIIMIMGFVVSPGPPWVIRRVLPYTLKDAMMVVMSTKKNTFLMPGKIEPLPHLDAVMDHIQDPFHGFCWDIGHNACYSPHIDMAKKYGQRLKCLHIHDNRGITRPGDIDYRDDLHLLPFDGILDWEWFAGQLRARSYEGPITLEVSCLHGDSYQAMTMPQYLAQAYQRGEKLRTLVDG